jgi:hypothetical protein
MWRPRRHRFLTVGRTRWFVRHVKGKGELNYEKAIAYGNRGSPRDDFRSVLGICPVRRVRRRRGQSIGKQLLFPKRTAGQLFQINGTRLFPSRREWRLELQNGRSKAGTSVGLLGQLLRRRGVRGPHRPNRIPAELLWRRGGSRTVGRLLCERTTVIDSSSPVCLVTACSGALSADFLQEPGPTSTDQAEKREPPTATAGAVASLLRGIRCFHQDQSESEALAGFAPEKREESKGDCT